MQKEVVVVGGGIIGLVIAKELAKSEVPVTLYEGKKRIGEGANKASGILSIGGLEGIGVNYKEAILNRLNGAVLYAGGEKLTIKAGGPKAYVLDREIFALLCAREAERAGAKIVTNTMVDKEMLSSMEKESIIVGADGVVSSVASNFGFPKINDYVLTYKAEYSNANIDDVNSCELFFSDAPKKFFGWTVPYSKDKLEVGIGEWMRSRRNSLSVFNAFVRNPMVNRELEGATKLSGHASIIPLQTRKTTVKGNVLLVGDAAGQVKATTGGGIVFGTMCAKTASEVIVSHIRKGTPLALYEKLWRKKYGLDLLMHKLIHRYYSGMGSRGSGLVFRIARLAGVENFLGEYGDMDRPSVVVRRLVVRQK
ncbi:MAG TPA: NAD(P)/FAD-dependent oxidoreductase [Candidatus Acidoferrum sp.]|nr:NAD(P)/FAD-dependent oxidoreductase [Candidatus Acidoferrum sp.]